MALQTGDTIKITDDGKNNLWMVITKGPRSVFECEDLDLGDSVQTALLVRDGKVLPIRWEEKVR